MTQSTQQLFWRNCFEQGWIYRQFPSGAHEDTRRESLKGCDFVDVDRRELRSMLPGGDGLGAAMRVLFA